MKKFTAIAGVAVTAAALVFPATAAQAVCANQAIWTQDGDSGLVKKWTTDGDLLETVNAGITASDMAISSDLKHFLAFDGQDLVEWDSTTGAIGDSTHMEGDGFQDMGAGLGVISGGKILTDSGTSIYSIDLSSHLAVDWADLTDADASIDLGLRGGSWEVAGDILQLPNNDILVVALNSNIDGIVLLRINKTDPSVITAVGTVDVGGAQIWGAARAGDDIFLATDGGSLLKLASVPTAASLAAVTTSEIVSGGGSFWGAAGSNDSTEGNATCELAETGVDTAPFGLAGAALIAAGGIALAVRRRKA